MKNEKKGKHPGYRWVMAGFIFLLAMGIFILVCGLVLGDGFLVLQPQRAL
ncbi:MAG: hypothetical protein IJB69_04710 [Clostridia bacterium]|nr:hypothetical protein [Clostridia bacterium]